MTRLIELSKLRTFLRKSLSGFGGFVLIAISCLSSLSIARVFGPTDTQPVPVIAHSPPAQVYVLPGPPDLALRVIQAGSLILSSFAIALSWFALKKQLDQKAGEQRANFFHAVVVDNVLDQLISFYDEIRIYIASEILALESRAEPEPVRARKVREIMREIRSRRSKISNLAAGRMMGIAPELAQETYDRLDEFETELCELIELRTDNQSAVELSDLNNAVLKSQTQLIRLLWDGEFKQEWVKKLV
jgi:hypothetical protein